MSYGRRANEPGLSDERVVLVAISADGWSLSVLTVFTEVPDDSSFNRLAYLQQSAVGNQLRMRLKVFAGRLQVRHVQSISSVPKSECSVL